LAPHILTEFEKLH